ncbi:MAG: hypothetical protein WA081_04290 [Desulfosalsimonadaceae bacterium]
MYISIDNINIPNERNDYILARVSFMDFISDDTCDVDVSVKLPSTDLPLSEIRQNALNDAKRILLELLKQL